MKILRLFLLLCIVWVALWSGRQTYTFVFDLLDFQIGAYKVMLQTWEQFADIKESVWWFIEQAMWLFWNWSLDSAVPWESISDIESKLLAFEKKIKIVSAIVWLLVAYIVWKFLFDIIFGLTRMMSKLSTFIG